MDLWSNLDTEFPEVVFKGDVSTFVGRQKQQNEDFYFPLSFWQLLHLVNLSDVDKI